MELKRLLFICACICCLAPRSLVHAQSQTAPASRADEIREARRAKQPSLRPDGPDQIERTFIRVQDLAEKFTSTDAGLRLKLSSSVPGWGGLITGSGFSVGTEFYRPDLAGGEVAVRASAVGTTKFSYLFDTQLTLPRLAGDTVSVDTLARYKSERSVDYYGPGPDSPKTDRTNYGKETSEIGLNVGVKATRHLMLGAIGGSTWFNVGPGRSQRISSTEEIFDPSRAPGVQLQTDFLRAGVYAEFDSRNKPYLPGRGTQLRARYEAWHDRNSFGYSFNTLRVEARQAIPFLNEKRVIALRARTVLTYAHAADAVPFYLQPTIGGPEDLRGFRSLRFTDNNSLLLNGEYRWEVAPPIEMAVFADAGKVFPRPGQLNFTNLETAGGFGIRIKTRTAVAARLDTAFSREGLHIWLRFSDVY